MVAELLSIDPAIGAAAVVGMVLGLAAGVGIGAALAARPSDPPTASEIAGAYLLGYQDGAEGVACDTTRPASLG